MIPERFLSLQAEGRLNGLAGELAENGFAILRGAADPDFIQSMSRDLDARFERTPFCIGPFHGHLTKRFHRLLARSEPAAKLVLHPEILDTTRTLLGLWCDYPELNLTQGVEIHPGAPAQIPHADQAMWPAPKGSMELCINVFWPMTSFTATNGATRIWPGSHLRPRRPEDPLGEPLFAEMEPGAALVILGSTVHAAGANISSAPRRAAIISYCLGWLKAYENQSLAYPPKTAKKFSPELTRLIGYRWHRPNLGTYDGQCPSILLEEEVPEHLATVDALSAQHKSMVADFARAQLSAAGAR